MKNRLIFASNLQSLLQIDTHHLSNYLRAVNRFFPLGLPNPVQGVLARGGFIAVAAAYTIVAGRNVLKGVGGRGDLVEAGSEEGQTAV